MTIDAFDWAHRTGANPPDEPTSDLCTSRPARPRLYEGTFAHEWQHLLHYYTDPFESTWMNEGLSDFAQTLTGYVNAARRPCSTGAPTATSTASRASARCRRPFNPNPRDCGGPENSLNLWGEGNPNAVLADYGNAYSLMLYLSRPLSASDIISRLHRDGDLQGIPSLEANLTAEGANDLYRVLHDFQTSTLVDKMVGDATAVGWCSALARVTSRRRACARASTSRTRTSTTIRGRRRTARTTSRCRRPTAPCSRGVTCGP